MQQYRAVCRAAREPRGIIGLQPALSPVIAPPETDRSSNYSKAFSIPNPAPHTTGRRGLREVGGSRRGSEKEHKTRRSRGGAGEGGGPPFIPETELPVRSH